MDFPVEAAVDLSVFHNEEQARDILRSHGFALTNVSSGSVRVKGSFRELGAVKASLEQILTSQAKMDILPSSSSLVPKVSSGAVSKSYYSNSNPVGNRVWSGSPNKPPRASPSSPTAASFWGSGSSNKHQTSPELSASHSPGRDKFDTVRPGESFIVDADVFDYANHFRKKEIDNILYSHNTEMKVFYSDDSYQVCLTRKNSVTAAAKLQSLLNHLSISLRTQEVSLKDMDREGKALLEKIKTNGNVHNSVLLSDKNDKLRLVGPSSESYELKQRLLSKPVQQSGRTGRTLDRSLRRRSSSQIGRRTTERDTGTIADPPPVGATGYSPSKYQDDKQKSVEPKGKASPFKGFMRRIQSEPRQKTQAVRTNGNVQDVGNKQLPPVTSSRGRQQLLKIDMSGIKQKFKSLRK